ncbi:MAG: phenylacetate--CoA ligase family protein [Proteobacteria bacterium]|nr:phenylacetate--CoA ligase family protein [Pseudomonadota bacterium]
MTNRYPTYLESIDAAALLRDYPLAASFDASIARLSAAARRELQQQRFARCVARAWQIPFYQRLWRNAGLEPGDVRGLDDIGKLPIFSKSDLMASLAEFPPYGDYHGMEHWPLAVRPPVVVHTTSGTTGRPQIVFFSPKAREVQALLVARSWQLHGVVPGDVIHSVYGHGMINGGHFVREAAIHYTNCLFLSAGTGKETRSSTQIELMRDMRVTVLVGFVDYIRKLATTAQEMGLQPGVDLPVKLIAGQIGRESRAALSSAWGGAQIRDWYGVADTGPIAAEGADEDGLYVYEDAHYLELIDLSRGTPIANGESGDMVVTSLYRDDIYPLIRFNTHDVTRWVDGQSSLGWTLPRIAGVLGRSDNMVKLRGINVYPLALSGILNEIPEFTGEYICRATRDATGRDELTVVIEVRGAGDTDRELAQRCQQLLSRRLAVEVNVQLVPTGETAALTEVESRQKPKRLIDERKLV